MEQILLKAGNVLVFAPKELEGFTISKSYSNGIAFFGNNSKGEYFTQYNSGYAYIYSNNQDASSHKDGRKVEGVYVPTIDEVAGKYNELVKQQLIEA